MTVVTSVYFCPSRKIATSKCSYHAVFCKELAHTNISMCIAKRTAVHIRENGSWVLARYKLYGITRKAAKLGSQVVIE